LPVIDPAASPRAGAAQASVHRLAKGQIWTSRRLTRLWDIRRSMPPSSWR